MAELHTYKKLPSDPCLSEEQILAYIDGKLSAAEQHACETHMADCAMCEDAAEGFALVKDRSVLAAPFPVEKEKTEGKVVPLHQPKRRMWYAAAAVLVLVLGATFILNMISKDSEATSLAENTKAQYDSSVIAPADDEAFRKELHDAPVVANEPTADQRTIAPEDGTPAEGYRVAGNEANGAMEGEEPIAPPVQAEASEEKVVAMERVLADEIADGDNEDIVVTKPEVVRNEGKDKAGTVDDAKKESEKNNLLEFATGIAGGAKKTRAESQKQDSYVDNNRDDVNAPAVSNTTVVGNTSTQPKASLDAGGPGMTDSSFALSGGIAIAQDSVAVADQLELSYQNGLNQLNAGQANSAIVLFDKVLTNKNHARYEDAEFQKAKALIKANKKEDAKTLLKSIEAKKGKHAAEATELLKTIQ